MKNLKKALFLFLLITIGAVIFLFSCETRIEENVVVVPEDKILPPPSRFDSTKAIKENILINYVAKAGRIKPNKRNGKPFDNLDYDKIIAYDFVGSEEPYPNVIDERGRFVPVVLAQEFLNQEQADKFLSTLTKKSTYGEVTAACFNPHFSLVFFKNNKKVNEISICLDCNYLISNIEIPAERYKKADEGTKYEYPLTGFSKLGKTAVIELCKELNFTYGKSRIEEKM